MFPPNSSGSSDGRSPQLPQWVVEAYPLLRLLSREHQFVYRWTTGEIVIVGADPSGLEEIDFPGWLESVHPGDHRLVLNSLDKLIRGDVGEEKVSYRRTLPSGGQGYFDSVLRKQGDLIYGAIFEETEGRQRFDSLSEQLAAVNLADQLAGVASAIYDFANRRAWATPAYLQWFKLSPNDSPLPIATYARSVAEVDRSRVEEGIRRVLQTGGTEICDHRANNSFGKELWVRMRLDAFLDQGIVAKLVVSLTDITEQMLATIALRQRDEQLRAAIEASFDAFMLLDAVLDDSARVVDFTFRHLNRLSEKLIGQEIRNLLGRSVRETLQEPAFRKFFFYYREALETRKTLVREEGFELNGSIRWYRHQVVPISNSVAITVSDVTSQRQDQQLLVKQKEELEAANAKLRDLARIDGLTGVYNRRAFEERLVEEVERSDRYGTPLSLVMLDIDNFKLFNDHYGHQFGDEVLRHVAQLLNQSARGTDFVARYGGEELTAILPMTTVSEAALFAERFRNRLKGSSLDGKTVTASFGCAQHFKGPDAAADLVARADAAQYVSKRSGKDRVTADSRESENG